MTEDLEKLKKKRGVVRQMLTKLLKKIEATVATEEVELEVSANIREELLEYRAQLLEKEGELEILNDKIEALTAIEDFEMEVTVSQEYKENIVVSKSRVLSKLNKLNTVKGVQGIEMNGVTDNSLISDQSNLNKVELVEAGFDSRPVASEYRVGFKTVRLPKLEIEKYFGDASRWMEFWQQYEAAIHSNDNLSKVQKFGYLKSLLGGLALNAVSGFSLTAGNYDSAIVLLKNRYGREDIVINSLMCKLLNVEPVKNSSNIKALRRLYDTCEIQIRSLESLNVTCGMYGHLLYPILLKLIPDDIALEFSRKRLDMKEFDLMELVRFLKREIECRETALVLKGNGGEKSSGNSNAGYKQNNWTKERVRHFKNTRGDFLNRTHELLVPVAENTCLFCNSSQHSSENCESLNVHERRDLLRKQGRCYLCLQTAHVIRQCLKRDRCEICKGKHSRAICYQNQSKKETSETTNIVSAVSHCESDSSREITDIGQGGKNVFLQTCTTILRGDNGFKQVRILLDSGSMRTFIIREVARDLKLPIIRKEKLSVYSFGTDKAVEKNFNVVKIKLENRNDCTSKIEIEALETEQITATQISSPTMNVIKANKLLKGLQLADCYNFSQSKIAVLIGADYYYNIASGRIKRLNETFVATETIFGWCLQGRSGSDELLSLNVIVEEVKVSDQLRQFWELENLGVESKEKDEDIANEVLREFESSICYENKRYTVKLPWKSGMKELLHDNRQVAEHRFMKLRSRFKSDKILFAEYKLVMDEYMKDGIMELVPVESKGEGTIFYLPHTAVIREDRVTSKLRVVFDASSHAKGELSLNDCLITGINLNPDLFSLLIRFRENAVAFTADIKQAFLQINIHQQDRDATRFLWDDDPFSEDKDVDLKTFRMTRVLFGVNSSPFLLAATIKHHLKRYVNDFPETYSVLDSSLYVDDLIGGQSTVERAFKISTESVAIFKDASMILRKWQTNSIELCDKWKSVGLIQDVSEPMTRTVVPLKVLGVAWDPGEDVFYFNSECLMKFISKRVDSKRFLLQTAGRIFDPVGFLGPFMILIKCIIQEVWCLGLDWDKELPSELRIKWVEWCREVEELNYIKIPRYYFIDPLQEEVELVQMHCFSDASKRAYGAVIYLRVLFKNGKIRTSFVSSKSRVAPLKTITLPRLELMGALLSARLGKRIAECLSFKVIPKFWTDSTITYYWIRGFAERFKPFVKHRVQEIQELSVPDDWFHCPGRDNPADLISRGLIASKLKDSHLWWYGPSWLSEPECSWPKIFECEECDRDREMMDSELKKEYTVNLSSVEERNVSGINDLLIDRYSSFSKLCRITAWCLRFIENCKSIKSKRICGYLTALDIKRATLKLVRAVQISVFETEIKCLRSKNLIPNNSKLLSLNVYLDDDGLLRVGGRLEFSNLSSDQKHQLLIPKNHRFTELLIGYFHVKSLHSGIQSTLSLIRQLYWIPSGRDRVRRVISRCMICFRTKNRTLNQLMGDLPKNRIVPSRPFSRVGIDFAGPIVTKPNMKRTRVTLKSYIALFICFSTKAVHLEIVSDLTSEAFLASFKRFISRRGKPSEVYSDNATNFVGAKNTLNLLCSICCSQSVQQWSADEGIIWHFIPPVAPHFGGLWESNIKTMKQSLIKTVQATVLNYEELSTLIVQIEACMNSRPLTPLSSDPADLQPLTPGHFLIGAPLLSLPEPDLSQNVSLSSRWTLLQELRVRFWRRWSQDYLNELQNRGKWNKSAPNLEVGQLVVIKERNMPPQKWKLGRVVQTCPGLDGLVRVVMLKTSTGTVKRSITSVCPLPFDSVELRSTGGGMVNPEASTAPSLSNLGCFLSLPRADNCHFRCHGQYKEDGLKIDVTEHRKTDSRNTDRLKVEHALESACSERKCVWK